MSIPHQPPLKHKRTTLERAEKFISTHYFTDVNLQSKLYPEKQPLKEIGHYAASDRIPYDEALKGTFKPTSVGQSFGPVWSTHWFEINIKIPESWIGKEVHFLWNSGCEALVWIDGEPRQGLNEMKEKNFYILSNKVDSKNLCFKLYVEMACNTLFGVCGLGRYNKEDELRKFSLSQADIAVFDRDAFDLIQDIESLHDISKEFGGDQRGYQALYTVNNIMNALTSRDKSQWQSCREMAKAFFNQKNGESQHTLYAMGHAHIDTAWLWPFAETIRKCARSWSCSLRLMEKYPDFIFCCSQAQQFTWVKEHYPSLWNEIRKFVAKGQFVPVGGSWVEMDGNIPSGEACIRQFVYGQNFFMKEFGVRCKEFWLPDTFGYSAQFPQILQHCGITRFLSQKLSWSLVNKFPHHTFLWEGIDGSSVLAHFPPGDSYEMKGTVKELRKSVNNFNDKGRSNRSAFLFGHGDGGHGPSEEMLGRLSRFTDCDGLPRVKMSSSDEFFSSIEKEGMDMLCRWRGELYLELHNGTYTTWAQVKKGNRQCEILLQEVEAVCTMAFLKNKDFKYPYDELERLWKLLLLNQFHDVLPGSSISQVFTDATKYYQDIRESGSKLFEGAVNAIVTSKGTGHDQVHIHDKEEKTAACVINTQGFERCELVNRSPCSDNDKPAAKKRKVENGEAESELVQVKVPPMSVLHVEDCLVSPERPVTLTQKGDNFVLRNDLIQAVIDPLGRVVSLTCVDPNNASGTESKEAVNPSYPANQFVLYDDIPLFWDAWDVMDYHLETRKPLCDAIESVEISNQESPLRASLKFSMKISDESHLQQEIVLDSGSPYLRFNTEVTWAENRKFLKVEFPTTIHAMEVTYDIQSGFLRRPNHFNTSWDSARFEVYGHKWADISEHGFGVSILNDCKYGYSAVDGVIRLSLLRSPKNPDPGADMGVHSFSYAMMPHFGTFQEAGVIQQAMAFNCPLKTGSGLDGACNLSPLFSTNTTQVSVQTVKMAEDKSSTVILRLNESFGGSVKVEISSSIHFSDIKACNGLEEVLEENDLRLEKVETETGGRFSLYMKPFQIVSLMCIQ